MAGFGFEASASASVTASVSIGLGGGQGPAVVAENRLVPLHTFRFQVVFSRAVLPGFFAPVEVAATLPSTMLRAAELAAAGAPEGATVLASNINVDTQGHASFNTATLAAGSHITLRVSDSPAIAVSF